MPSALMRQNEAIAWATRGQFICQVERRVDGPSGDAIGVGHDWDHAIDKRYVYVLRGSSPQNDWEPLAGPFPTQAAAEAWIAQLIGWPR